MAPLVRALQAEPNAFDVKVCVYANAFGQVCQRNSACAYEIVNAVNSSTAGLSFSSFDAIYGCFVIEDVDGQRQAL